MFLIMRKQKDSTAFYAKNISNTHCSNNHLPIFPYSHSTPLTLSFLITAKIRYNASHFSSADINIPVARSFIRGFYDNSCSCLGGSSKRGQIHPIQSPNPYP